jgi:hypothetical protein
MVRSHKRTEVFHNVGITLEQENKLNSWLEICRRVWNLGLSLLIEHEENTVGLVVGYDDGKDKKPIYSKTERAPVMPFGFMGLAGWGTLLAPPCPVKTNWALIRRSDQTKIDLSQLNSSQLKSYRKALADSRSDDSAVADPAIALLQEFERNFGQQKAYEDSSP